MTTMTTCRACTGQNLLCYLPLGDHPPANAFPRGEDLGTPDIVFPLNSYACLDCGLIQIPDQLPPDFYVDYVYIPSASSTMPLHFQALARTFQERLITAPGQRVVDIGCNDGLLLAACRDLGLETLGIDPAANIAELARAKGVDVVTEYFTPATAAQVRRDYGPAQVIITTNVLNHIDDLHGFMTSVCTLLAEDGHFVIEVPQALTCIELNEFDTVYHEHLSVFSVTSVVALGRRVGLELVGLDDLPIHGGSMRLYMRRHGPARPEIAEWLQREKDAKLFSRETYEAHAARVHVLRTDLMVLLHGLKAEGKRLAGYGAPAKGNTMLNYCGIGTDLLDFLADRNPLKQGRFSPGMRIPVLAPDAIAERRPDYLLILAWNFADEIMEQQRDFAQLGGRFILPIPMPHVIG